MALRVFATTDKNMKDKNFKTTHRGYTIEFDVDRAEYIAYPTDQGIDHDYDQQGDRTVYCGNALWSTDVDSLKDDIDDRIISLLEVDLHHHREVVNVYLSHQISVMTDQLAIARQCIEACREEFRFRFMHPGPFTSEAVAHNMMKLCTTALSNLPATDSKAAAQAIDGAIQKMNTVTQQS